MIDTRSTMVGAYVVVSAVYLGYIATLWARARRLRALLRAAGERRPGE